MNTAQGVDLRILVETIQSLLEIAYSAELLHLGIQRGSSDFIGLEDLVAYQLLDEDHEKNHFQLLRKSIHEKMEEQKHLTRSTWEESYLWILDRIVFLFFSRIFWVRVMEEIGLINESTLKPQADLGNYSSKFVKIKEKYVDSKEYECYRLMIKNAFDDLSNEIEDVFDEYDPLLQILPSGKVIKTIINQLNELNPDYYLQDDVLGWFYHFYVVKFRKQHKTMAAHGSKHPQNPYYLSILNTVYTPLWMIQTLVDNSLGRWWSKSNPNSSLLTKSQYLIQKEVMSFQLFQKPLNSIRIIDPACGSGNFLLYVFRLLYKMYRETNQELSVTEVLTIIIKENIFGIDLHRRPIQLAKIGLFILAKRILLEEAPEELEKFIMPTTNLVSCEIKVPKFKTKLDLIDELPSDVKVLTKEILSLFEQANQIGSLIDIQGITAKLERKQTQRLSRDNNEGVKYYNTNEIIEFILKEKIDEKNLSENHSQNTKETALFVSILRKKYDFIVGNPPFGLVIKDTQDILRKYYPNSYIDLVSMFVDKSLRMCNNNGYIAMVTDFSFMHLSKFTKFRKQVLLKNSTILNILQTGYGALPNAGNRPILFILNKTANNGKARGLHRYVDIIDQYRNFPDDFLDAIHRINSSKDGSIPHEWNIVNQNIFSLLPHSIIDLNLNHQLFSLLEWFKRYPRLDIGQLKDYEKKGLPRSHLARAYQGLATGNNWIFVKYWFEVPPSWIRKMEQIDEISQVPDNRAAPFVPYSKGGGDYRYYLQNPYVLWWNKEAVEEMDKYYSVHRNIPLQGKSDINWSLSSGTVRSRFCISLDSMICDVASMSIYILDNSMDKFTLVAYLNSKIGTFFGRLQSKERKWQPGNIARFPVPIEFLLENQDTLSPLAREYFNLLREWDTIHPYSPIFERTLFDFILEFSSNTNRSYANHPFSEIIFSKVLFEDNELKKNKTHKITILSLFEKGEAIFEDFKIRLGEINSKIDRIISKSVSKDTAEALDEYFERYFGEVQYQANSESWLKDFIMVDCINILRSSSQEFLPLDNYLESTKSLYQELLSLYKLKFEGKADIRDIIKEMENYLSMSLKSWVQEELFYYHCQRFGGRPIIWQFTSKQSNDPSVIDIFVDYYRITENTLGNIRGDILHPYLITLENNNNKEKLDEGVLYEIKEIKQLIQRFVQLEKGYQNIPSANVITGNNAQKGKGADKTYEWVFNNAAEVIKGGYSPDLMKGVLVNILPLNFIIPEKNRSKLKSDYAYICPKDTLKYVLKKIVPLDQLKERKKSDS